MTILRPYPPNRREWQRAKLRPVRPAGTVASAPLQIDYALVQVPPFPRLATPRLLLRAPGEQDIPAWFARATDVASACLAGDPVPDDIIAGEQWLARSRQQFVDGTAIKWSIDREGETIGSITLTLQEADTQAAALGFVLARAYWGQGLATEAAREVVRHAFEALALERVMAEAATRNFASLRVLEKLGFREVESFVDPFDGEGCKRFTLEKDMRTPLDRRS